MGTSESDYYDRADLWVEGRFSNDQEERRFAATADLVPADATSLLDVGCGNGAFLAFVEGARPDLRVAGMERSDAARANPVCATGLAPGDMSALPFEDASWDVVTCLEVLEHLPWHAYDRAREELARVASRSVIVSVPYRETLAQTRCPKCGCRFNSYRHLRRFVDGDLPKLVPGFKLVRSQVVLADDNWVLAAKRRLHPFVAAGWRPTDVCPQCGYSRSVTAPVSAATPPARRLGLSRLVPRKKPYWVVCLYTR
jgi:SAM-dependent methyltransferase